GRRALLLDLEGCARDDVALADTIDVRRNLNDTMRVVAREVRGDGIARDGGGLALRGSRGHEQGLHDGTQAIDWHDGHEELLDPVVSLGREGREPATRGVKPLGRAWTGGTARRGPARSPSNRPHGRSA